MLTQLVPWIVLILITITFILIISTTSFLYYYLCCNQCRFCCKYDDVPIPTSITLPSRSNSVASQSKDTKDSLYRGSSPSPPPSKQIVNPPSTVALELSQSKSTGKIECDLRNHSSKKRKKKIVDINNYFKYTTVVAATAFTMVSVLTTTSLYYIVFVLDEFKNKTIFESDVYISLNGIGHVFGVSARIAVLVLLNGRLYYTFKGSAYRISKKIFYGLNSVVSLIVIAVIVSIVKPSFKILNVFVLLFTLLDMIMLLYLFNKRLLKLTTSRTLSDVKLKNEHSNAKSVNLQLNRSERVLIDAITRNTLLISLIITVGNIPTIFAVYFTLSDGGVNKFEIVILFCISSVFILFNLICISLIYQFSNKYYNMLCKCGHKGCLKLCTGCAKRQIVKDLQSSS